MQSLLDMSVYWGCNCFGVDFRSLLRVKQNWSELCIDKECICIWYHFKCGSRGRDRGSGPPLENHKLYGFL